MNNNIESIVRRIVEESKGPEEILEKVKKQFPGVEVNMKTIGLDTSEKSKNHESCECLICEVEKVINNTKFFKSDEVKKGVRYTIANEHLNKEFGNNLNEWIKFFGNMSINMDKIVKDFSKNLKEVEMGKMTLQIINDNIARLINEQKAQK